VICAAADGVVGGVGVAGLIVCLCDAGAIAGVACACGGVHYILRLRKREHVEGGDF
jgi:hypothetical protein